MVTATMLQPIAHGSSQTSATSDVYHAWSAAVHLTLQSYKLAIPFHEQLADWLDKTPFQLPEAERVNLVDLARQTEERLPSQLEIVD